jgi:pyruvate-ferredoxin/flavodoxin oxidoreductase
VKSGYWPLYRYKPTTDEHERPFQLDSAAPSIPLKDFALKEARFSMLARSNPDRSAELLELAQQEIDERWRYYEQLADVERAMHEPYRPVDDGLLDDTTDEPSNEPSDEGTDDA